MDDIISRSALLQDIENCVVFSGRPGTASAELRGANKVTDRIKAAPAVDAVEVVRCKECFKRYSAMCLMRFFDYEDGEYFDFTRNNYFCSSGERKRNEND